MQELVRIVIVVEILDQGLTQRPSSVAQERSQASGCLHHSAQTPIPYALVVRTVKATQMKEDSTALHSSVRVAEISLGQHLGKIPF